MKSEDAVTVIMVGIAVFAAGYWFLKARTAHAGSTGGQGMSAGYQGAAIGPNGVYGQPDPRYAPVIPQGWTTYGTSSGE